MTRLALERAQVLVYLVAIAAGLLLGVRAPALAPWLSAALWPVLAALLFVTFLQVPLLHLRAAFADHRFVAAALIGNFVLVPLLVAALVTLLPADPALRLGVLLVLLVPCTDWFLSFCQLGGGDLPRAIAVTPLYLLLQSLLLPLYLWGLADGSAHALPTLSQAGPALAIVLLPLLLAAGVERWIEAEPARDVVRERLAWWTVPLLALVVGLIAASQAPTMASAMAASALALPVFVAYLIVAVGLAWLLARVLHLPARQGRTLAYSFGTRNSFVVLPFALMLPKGYEIAAMVIVLQSLVELVGMLVYLGWLPRLFPDTRPG